HWAHGSAEAARLAFDAVGARLKRSGEDVAHQLLDRAVDKIAEAVAEAAKTHGFGPEVPVVAVGGAGTALAPRVAQRLGRPLLRPADPEVLSSIGAALSLVRAEIVRHCSGPGATAALAHDAERACVDAGAAPMTVTVTAKFEARNGWLRAVATGAVALESGAAGREPLDEDGQRAVAATVTGADAERQRRTGGRRRLGLDVPLPRGRARAAPPQDRDRCGGRRDRAGRADRRARDQRRPAEPRRSREVGEIGGERGARRPGGPDRRVRPGGARRARRGADRVRGGQGGRAARAVLADRPQGRLRGGRPRGLPARAGN